MKKDQYFNLEVNLLNDDNIAGMMSELDAAEALGIYVMLLLHLRTKDNYEASCRPLPLKALAKRYDVDVDLIGMTLSWICWKRCSMIIIFLRWTRSGRRSGLRISTG